MTDDKKNIPDAGKVVDFTPRIRARRRTKQRMRPSPAGAAHPRLIRRPPTRPSRNLGTKCPKADHLRGKALPSKQRPRLQPSNRPPSGRCPWRERGDRVSQSFGAAPIQNPPLWRPGRCGNAGAGGVGQGCRGQSACAGAAP